MRQDRFETVEAVTAEARRYEALIAMAEREGNELLVWKYKALKNGMVAEFLSDLVEVLARRLPDD